MIRKIKTGFQVDISNGRNRRHRKSFKTRIEAQQYERYFLSNLNSENAWNLPKQDKRHLLDLIDLWYQLHGQTLKDGEGRARLLRHTAAGLGNPVASNLTANDFSHYRSLRLQKVKPKTINNEQVYLSSVFNELNRFKEINYRNPILGVRQIKIPERELAYLENKDINKLFDKLKLHQATYQVSLLCLTCGLRWGEAKNLKHKDIKNGKINLSNTKSGKNRYIPIRKELASQLKYPLTEANSRFFAKCFKEAKIKKAAGQNTHILRHTFASHFIMNGGDILTLQKILGHSDLRMTMKYAHLSENHLNDVLKFGPNYVSR